MSQPVIANHQKTTFTGTGDMPFELTVNDTTLRLEQDETKIVLSVDGGQYAANMMFDIYYPNGSPDEMADREYALRDEIKSLKGMFQPPPVSLGESKNPVPELPSNTMFIPVKFEDITEGWYLLDLTSSKSKVWRYVVRYVKKCNGYWECFDGTAPSRASQIDRIPGLYNAAWRIADHDLLCILNRDAVPLGGRAAAKAPQPSPTIAARDKELEDALAARDLYKSQLESLHAKYEALVNRNGSFHILTLRIQELIGKTMPGLHRCKGFLESLEDAIRATKENF